MTGTVVVTPLGLPRRLTLLALVLLTLSAITPASSMFIEIPVALSTSGTGIGLVLLLSGFVGLIMAFVYSELGTAFPSCGGEYVFVNNVLGRLGQPVAYIVIFINFVVMALIPAVLGLGTGEFFRIIMPGLDPSHVALAVIAVSTIVGILNIQLNAVVACLFLTVEAACMIFFSYESTTHLIAGRFAVLTTLPFMTVINGVGATGNMPAITTAMATVLFAFNGYEQAIYLTDETKRVRKVLHKAIIISLLTGLIFEAYPTLTLVLASKNLLQTFQSPSPYLDFISVVVGPGARYVMALAISLAVLNATIVNILMTGRFVFSTGRDNVWGQTAGHYLAQLHASQRTPWFATLAVGVLGLIAAVSLPLETLTVLSGTGLALIYLILCVCLIVGRYNQTTKQASFRVPGGPIVATVGAVSLFVVLIVNWFDPTSGHLSVIYTIYEAIAGFVLFCIARFALGHRWTPVVPEEDVHGGPT